MMVVLDIDTIGRAWSNCFLYHYIHHCGWEGLDTKILNDWRGQLVFDKNAYGALIGIKFEHDSDATLFLLRWA